MNDSAIKEQCILFYGLNPKVERILEDEPLFREPVDNENSLVKLMSMLLHFSKRVQSCVTFPAHRSTMIYIMLDALAGDSYVRVSEPRDMQTLKEHGSAGETDESAVVLPFERARDAMTKISGFLRAVFALSASSLRPSYGLQAFAPGTPAFPPRDEEEKKRFGKLTKVMFDMFQVVKDAYFYDWEKFKESVRNLSGRIVVNVYNESTKQTYEKKIMLEKEFQEGCLIVATIGMASHGWNEAALEGTTNVMKDYCDAVCDMSK